MGKRIDNLKEKILAKPLENNKNKIKKEVKDEIRKDVEDEIDKKVGRKVNRLIKKIRRRRSVGDDSKPSDDKGKSDGAKADVRIEYQAQEIGNIPNSDILSDGDSFVFSPNNSNKAVDLKRITSDRMVENNKRNFPLLTNPRLEVPIGSGNFDNGGLSTFVLTTIKDVIASGVMSDYKFSYVEDSDAIECQGSSGQFFYIKSNSLTAGKRYGITFMHQSSSRLGIEVADKSATIDLNVHEIDNDDDWFQYEITFISVGTSSKIKITINNSLVNVFIGFKMYEVPTKNCLLPTFSNKDIVESALASMDSGDNNNTDLLIADVWTDIFTPIKITPMIGSSNAKYEWMVNGSLEGEATSTIILFRLVRKPNDPSNVQLPRLSILNPPPQRENRTDCHAIYNFRLSNLSNKRSIQTFNGFVIFSPSDVNDTDLLTLQARVPSGDFKLNRTIADLNDAGDFNIQSSYNITYYK